MRKKTIIGFLATIIIVIGVIIMRLWIIGTDRTNEEYVAVFLDNREDFAYVAEMMKQWPDRSIIELDESISSEDPEIADEIENNAELYEHLKNLHNLEEVDKVVRRKGEIEFSFNKPPKDYHGGWFYWDNMDEKGILTTYDIGEHWTLEMLPNV